MNNYADRLIESIRGKGNPCCVGLDPRLDEMPTFISERINENSDAEEIRLALSSFAEVVLDAVSKYVPAVKPQIAFYEQYGIGGILAFYDTIQMAKDRGLIVIVDAKRGDIASTAAAYANAFLGRVKLGGVSKPMFDVDCITVSPFLGRDTLEPFVDACNTYGKGIFVLVKTSNPGSKDLQDLIDNKTQELIYMRLAYLVNEIGSKSIGQSGYSSIGAVVGATFPSEAQMLRKVMSRAFFLVPGYGTQGGHAQDAALCFNSDGMGAIVNAARSITYGFKDQNISRAEYSKEILNRALNMINEVLAAIRFPTTTR